MDGLELIAFTIISTVGTAKSNVMESMSLARSGKFEEAEAKVKAANEFLRTSEKEHFKVITQEAKEKNVELSLLFIHAEDQLMTTVCLRDVAVELIETNKKIAGLSDTIDQLVEAQK